ncbi:DsbA family protein [Sulfitobacter sp. SK012]|uniref:DsbA family protein n=1 Tax=Sulfitobacter sp. SK012 TaxID=1389005 RepID=UPI0020C7E8EF|nr:DsbA family protein [Sulfitobacter sp. SK012]
MRLPDLAKKVGIEFRWRPFDVRHVMIGKKNIPFKNKPVKTAYMWRDIERMPGTLIFASAPSRHRLTMQKPIVNQQ